MYVYVLMDGGVIGVYTSYDLMWAAAIDYGITLPLDNYYTRIKMDEEARHEYV